MCYCQMFDRITLVQNGSVSAIGRVSRFAFGSLQVGFLGPAHSFTSCQLLVKG